MGFHPHKLFQSTLTSFNLAPELMTPRSVMFADVSPPFSASTAQVAALIVSHGGVPR